MSAAASNAGRGRAALRRAPAAAALVLAGALLAGCSALGGIVGAVAGAASGSASGNPGVGIAVAIGVKTAIDLAQKNFDRYWQEEEQDIIATLIGATPVGEERPWAVHHAIPYEDKQGRLRVLRTFTTALAECKEALFSVEQTSDSQAQAEVAASRAIPGAPAVVPGMPKAVPYFVTLVCRADQGDDWEWALAEPAVARWGAMH